MTLKRDKSVLIQRNWIFAMIVSAALISCKTPVHALVTSTLDFGNAALFGIAGTLLHRLETVQRAAARVVLCIDSGTCNFFQVTGHIALSNGAGGQIMSQVLMEDKRNVGYSEQM